MCLQSTPSQALLTSDNIYCDSPRSVGLSLQVIAKCTAKQLERTARHLKSKISSCWHCSPALMIILFVKTFPNSKINPESELHRFGLVTQISYTTMRVLLARS
ncbi:hypothetical protein CEXT_334181 [Caerostris extrusa]|uniref:Uncharacterized protein n=1 Tax=Caerostris extrusa TaxID=172846 RepID=A0AAV4MPB3_CAEEX|nr:hypothetical protein CEXT_775191 [Caerostris extrusa]GIY90624.1 hypothetical protein CEXT_334181 [Caerostris extrusa]